MTAIDLLNKYIDATNTHDFKNVQACLHPNAVYWFTGTNCTNMNEIQAYFENAWDTIKNEIYRAKDIHWLVNEADSATCIYTYEYEGYFNGKYVQGNGRATNVFVKDDQNEWKLIHEHLSNIK
ncbi:YybH family protein [Solibacillus daqui]|uniref:YybH family protein n=1 Tax=Solibacillus daqui TaxID=2912187 RepID=UPI002365D1D9|nr:nuclear transport factor 2 family protein [Solibacillus daqui]